jgi:hypothetical protein
MSVLPDALAQQVRDISDALGGILLLDSKRGRAILSDSAKLTELCRLLKRSGFTQFVDYTGAETTPGEVTLQLTLRAPEHAHSALVLKWKWNDPAYNSGGGAGQPGGQPLQAGPVVADSSLERPGGREPDAGGSSKESSHDLRALSEQAAHPAGGQPLQAGPVVTDDSLERPGEAIASSQRQAA